MPLPLPSLDSRSWEELMAEARARIPRDSPSWTDHNYHDPGITLLELMAWLTEMLLFRVDRPSPAAARAFLRWAGVELATARPASTVISLRSDAGAAALSVKKGALVSDATLAAIFQSQQDVLVGGAWLELSPVEGTDRGVLVSELSGALVARRQDVSRPAAAFEALGSDPRPGDALRIGFRERPAGSGEELTLHVWPVSWRDDADRRARATAEEAEARELCQPILNPCSPSPAEPAPVAADAAADASDCVCEVTTAWEYWTAAGWSGLSATDETAALTRSGFVRLTGPADWPAASDGRYWLRSRLVRGRYDCPPRLLAVSVNAVPVLHSVDLPGEVVLGVTTGAASQSFGIPALPRVGHVQPHAGVLAGTTRLRLGKDESWVEAPNFDHGGPGRRVYVLDPELGTAAFGDGRTGLVPDAGLDVTMVAASRGGGPGGNLEAGSLVAWIGRESGPSIVQPFGATGGAAAETLDQAHGRALDRLASASRAVTAADLENLARETPDAVVARAHALPGLHPNFPRIPAPGCVTVVVVPPCGRPPVPTPALLRSVTRYLARRRPVATELHVVGPSYLRLQVTARLHVAAGSPRARGLADAAQKALDAFFDPLTGGSGGGWAFGRPVLAGDVLGVLAGLPGVLFVDGLSLSSPDARCPGCDSLCLEATQLVDSGAHQFTVVEGGQ